MIRACARVRDETWITEEMIEAYLALHDLGYAHSFETWHAGNLVGGLYGVALGRAFFGESMFSVMSDASKVALVHLVSFVAVNQACQKHLHLIHATKSHRLVRAFATLLYKRSKLDLHKKYKLSPMREVSAIFIFSFQNNSI